MGDNLCSKNSLVSSEPNEPNESSDGRWGGVGEMLLYSGGLDLGTEFSSSNCNLACISSDVTEMWEGRWIFLGDGVSLPWFGHMLKRLMWAFLTWCNIGWVVSQANDSSCMILFHLSSGWYAETKTLMITVNPGGTQVANQGSVVQSPTCGLLVKAGWIGLIQLSADAMCG